MEFNEKLQELRKQKGLTQEELAKRLYISRTAISKWESGRGYPGIESLKSIAGFFSVTCVMPTAAMQLWERIKSKRLKQTATVAIYVFTAFMVAGRLISGVHWITDIIGGALLSAGLVMGYYRLSRK